MSFDNDWLKNGLPSFHGGKDKGQARIAIDRLGGPDGFKTDYRTAADGTVTITQTKGTMPPQVEIQKPKTATISSAVKRTFVFNYKNAAVGIVANKSPLGMTILTTKKVVGRAGYNVASFKTNLHKGAAVAWNDVWRLDRTPYTGEVLFSINSTSRTPIGVTKVADKGYSAIPFVVSTKGAYASVLNTMPPILPLFIGYSQFGIGHGVTSLKPTGEEQESISASINSTPGCAAGLRVMADGTFGFLGAAAVPGLTDPDTLSSVSVVWAKIQATATPPYLAALAWGSDGQNLGGLPTQDKLPTNDVIEHDPGGYALMPVYGRLVVDTFPWNFNNNETGDPPSWLIDYTYAWEGPAGVVTPDATSTLLKTTESVAVDKHLTWGMGDDTGNLIAEYSVEGQLSYTWWNGKIFQSSQYEIDSPISYTNEMYDGEERNGTSHSVTSLILRTQCSVPETTLLSVGVTINMTEELVNTVVTDNFGVAEWGETSEDGQLGYYYQPGTGWPVQPPTFIPLKRMRYGGNWNHYGPPVEQALIDAANAEGAANAATANAHAGEAYPVSAYPLKTITARSETTSTMTLTASTCDYVYADDVEGVYVYLESELVYSIANSTIMSVTTRTPTWSLSARYVVASRFGGMTATVEVGATDEPHFQVLSPFSSDSMGKGQYMTKYHGNFIPPPLFTPAFRNQGNCPHLSYTTLAEEAAGATAEFYLDMSVQARKYSTLSGRSIYGDVVEFVPHQFLHIYQHYLKNASVDASDDRNLHLFETMFPKPVRFQMTNGQIGGVQVGLDVDTYSPELSRT